MNNLLKKFIDLGVIDSDEKLKAFSALLSNQIKLITSGDLINRNLSKSKEKVFSLMIDDITKYYETKENKYLYSVCSGIITFTEYCSHDLALSLDDYVVLACIDKILRHNKG